ncbi:hypothetical protein A2U01_0053118, partial [Trifolium medium]|nr:hypothetical protein [Trifolium medium]
MQSNLWKGGGLLAAASNGGWGHGWGVRLGLVIGVTMSF